MPTGFHSGRKQTRSYIGEYHRIYAKSFKCLIDSELGNYQIDSANLDKEHCQFSLIESEEWPRVMIFTIKEKKIPIPLQQDNRSASSKLYLVCPCCVKQRESLYVLKYLFACRACANLHYGSQSESKAERLARRIRKQRALIWGYDWIDRDNLFEQSYYWPKPKGINWSTYYKKRMKLNELEKEYWGISRVQMERILNRSN
ncbi:hypothetical protein [Pseudocolwellia agarivorans]|uniref:hypothetical protein n=1 Tax=Pseudocolwellia agarivorans TaxID=1911682 RepID=UPI0009858732|nr:hypothetical protein [Pseudocolwellia agarivorans]